MLTVYRQASPIPIGQRFTRYDREGELRDDEWCRANFVKVGEAQTWAEAKKLCVAPVCEVKHG